MEKIDLSFLVCLRHESPEKVLEICMDLGLIARTYVCPKCGKNMSLRPRSDKIDKFEWVCRSKSAPSHRVKRSVRSGSYFERRKIVKVGNDNFFVATFIFSFAPIVIPSIC